MPKLTVRYLLCPGHVRSRWDGQSHYVSAEDLAQLYGVPMHQCVVRSTNGFAQPPSGLIELHPRVLGDYRLPSGAEPPPNQGITMSVFKFQLSAAVSIKASGETGTVIGRAEYLHAEPSYFVRYRAANGLAVEAWWSEDALSLAPQSEAEA